MSIDRLQEMIRKTKCPLAVDFSLLPEHIPMHILDASDGFVSAYKQYVSQLLIALKDTVLAVRFDFGALAIYGTEGVGALQELLDLAKKQGYYVFLEGIESLSQQSARRAAEVLFSPENMFHFDGLITVAYIGSDAIVPYVEKLKMTDKDLFVVSRTSNRSAPEMQDLLSGSRLSHIAKADIVNRFTDALMGRSGYSRIALVAAASSANSLRSLREKYKYLFLLLDGCDYPNANAKNCSYAFDRLGHGAIACAGLDVCAAWQEDGADADCLKAAVAAAERLKKNLTRYITVL